MCIFWEIELAQFVRKYHGQTQSKIITVGTGECGQPCKTGSAIQETVPLPYVVSMFLLVNVLDFRSENWLSTIVAQWLH